MQCHHYLPMYHSHYDHYVDAIGDSRSMHNGNGIFQSAHHNNYVPSLTVPQGNLVHKELLRQTMLIHEVTFKDQVQELHRIYKRQTDLMSEIKSKELCANHMQLENQFSIMPSVNLSSISGQSNLQNLPFHNAQNKPGFVDADDIQRALSYCNESRKPDSSYASHYGATLDRYPESKGRVFAGKLIDLELPAEVYIDGDEWESLGDAEYGEGRNLTKHPSNKPSSFAVEINDASTTANSYSDPGLQKGIRGSCSLQRTSSILTDLNEPPGPQLEESDWLPENEKTPEISERNGDPLWCKNGQLDDIACGGTVKSLAFSSDSKSEVYIGSGKNALCNMGSRGLIVQALPVVTNQPRSRKCVVVHHVNKGSNKEKFDARCSSSLDRPISLQGSCSESKLGSVAYLSPTNCIDLNGGTTRKTKRRRVIDINVCYTTADDELFEDDLVRHDDKDLSKMNMTTCVTDVRSPMKSSSLDKNVLIIDLEAPISPDVEECPPPRGDSEESQPEMTNQEGDDSLRKLVHVAAEAIVTISSSKSLSFLESKDLLNGEGCESGCLEWFAGLVHSFSNELGNDLGMLRHEDIDEFEALTLNLTELKPEEYWSISSVETSNLNSSLSLTGQTRKSRTRRSKKKDFQREVLPSLSSLSRYEVTEDIQMFEGLMEAAGTPWHLNTKRTCRMMVKKPRVLKRQMTLNEVPEAKNGFLVGWGKDNRRPRAQRSAANPAAIMSKWLNLI